MSKIPIKNIYYIFCYAWQKVSIGKGLSAGLEDASELQELLSKVLIYATNIIVKKGLDRNYLEHREDMKMPRGSIYFAETLKRNLLRTKKIHCVYDDLSHDVLHNQLIKSTLLKLSHSAGLSDKTKRESKSLALKLHGVREITITPRDFTRVRLHRNNSYYEFILNICEMINLNLFPTEGGQGYQFSDILNDEEKMGLVFERFVKNFYALEQDVFKVKSEEIRWNAEADDEDSLRYLPVMKTDISLTAPNRKIIIDTKFYSQTMQSHHGSEKIRSNHLYQLSSYLTNIQRRHSSRELVEGILLYPTVGNPLDLHFKIHGHKIRIYTLNLDREWSFIKEDLLALIRG